MAHQITVYNYRGEPLTDVRYEINVGWTLNRPFAGTMVVPITDDVFLDWQEELIQHGNRVLMQDDDAGWWAGVIDAPRTWSGNNIICSVWSAEYLFKFRRTPDEPISMERHAGSWYSTLIDWANAPEDLLVRAGQIWGGGVPHQRTYTANIIYDCITKLSDATGNDWRVVPQLVNNRLQFACDWFERMGEYQAYPLKEGYNMARSSTPLKEDGPIYNDIFGFGNLPVWAKNVKGAKTDPDSIGRYGLRQAPLSVDTNSQTSLDLAVQSELNRRKNTEKKLRPLAINKDNTFKYLGMGDVVPVIYTERGFTGGKLGMEVYARIVGKDYTPASGGTAVMGLTVEVVD